PGVGHDAPSRKRPCAGPYWRPPSEPGPFSRKDRKTSAPVRGVGPPAAPAYSLGFEHPGRDTGRMADERPQTDDRDPADVVTGMVDHVLGLVDTWSAWDGHPARPTIGSTRHTRPFGGSRTT